MTVASPKEQVSTEQIKALRGKTGAGVMECKRALAQAKGDPAEAEKILREKGASLAAEKAGRTAGQGLVGSYIHAGRIGVLVEVNCESDFVARNEDFKRFVHDICLQVASMNPRYVNREDVPEEDIGRELEHLQEELAQVDSEVAPAMQQSHMENFYKERVLMDQSFVKDPGKTVRDLLHETVAAIRENIVIRRFVRMTLGDTVESNRSAVS
ncbi:MAG: elongation factor Ts [Candidatus Omnitrophica bacterium CG11_big_fil_rev_8_21_14_0_20_64_10]|nr:MAG: elongation factor Ts [Candidatus Omnitrophica bacterium CG11_big_fil_rev_8_21_14_0_20_64_10]